MATETWTYDGVALSNYVGGNKIWDIRTWSGLDDIAGVNVNGSASGATTGTNGMFQLAQKHGEYWYPQYFTAMTRLLTMHVTTNNPSTGASPTSIDLARQNFDSNLDSLSLLFQRRRNLATVLRLRSDGTTRKGYVTVASVNRPTLIPVTDASITVELTFPDPFWWDSADTTLATLAAGFSGVVTALATATAPMNDMQFNITGPVTNPRVTDNESGSWFQYNGTVAAGKTLVVHNTNMGIDDGGSGWSPALANMQHAGDGEWLVLYPSQVLGGVNITFGGTSTSGATALALVGHKKFMR
jgi:hypothetical protein